MNRIVTLIFVVLALIVTQAGFGCSGILIKYFAQGKGVNPLIFSLLRDACAFPVLLVAGIIVEGFRFPALNQMPVMALLGFTGMFGNQLLYIIGLYLTTPDIASAFQPTTPVICILVAITLQQEPMPSLKRLDGLLKIFGIIVTSVGGVLMVLAPGSHESDGLDGSDSLKHASNLWLGNFLLFLNCTCTSFYVVIQKMYIFKQAPVIENEINQIADDSVHTAKSLENENTLDGKLDTPMEVFSNDVTEMESGLKEESIEVDLQEKSAEYAVSSIKKEPEVVEETTDVADTSFAGVKSSRWRCSYPETLKEWRNYPILLTAYSYFFGMIFMAITSLYYVFTDIRVFILPVDVLIPLAYATFITSALCYGLISFANKHVSSTIVTAFWPLQVFVANLMSFIVFHELLLLSQYIAGVCIIIGLLLVCIGGYVSETKKGTNVAVLSWLKTVTKKSYSTF